MGIRRISPNATQAMVVISSELTPEKLIHFKPVSRMI